MPSPQAACAASTKSTAWTAYRFAADTPRAGKVRLRWQAERPGALWHADVCHATALMIDGKSQPVRIHGILDDASRYILALSAHHTEREVDMLGLMVKAVRKHGPPDALYLDNGSTYRGQTLSLACARMGYCAHPRQALRCPRTR